MGKISLIIPAETTNLIANPSFETVTTGWTAVGSAIARIVTEQMFGVAALEIDTDNAAVDEGAYYTIDPALGAGNDYTASIWVKRDGGGTVNIRLRDQTNAAETVGAAVTLTAEWQRVSVTHTLTGASVDLRLYIETDVQQNITFYADAAQIEQQTTRTTYCDGEQPGCEWLGADHISTSRRSAQARAGGTVVDLDDYNVTVDTLIGFEMPPIRHNVHNLPLQSGAFLQSTKAQPRVLQLVGRTDTASESAQYTALQNVINAFKSDRVATLQPVILRYTGASKTVEIPCYYDTGLEGNFQCTSFSQFTMRLIAYDPFWKQIGESAEELDEYDDQSVQEVCARVDGAWTDLGSPTISVVDAVTVGLDRLVYFTSNMLNIAGIGDADYIVAWNPVTEAFEALAAGGTGRVWCLAVGPDGTIYLGGDFTNWDGDGDSDYIVLYDPSTQTYSPLLAGGTQGVLAMAVDNVDGSLYFGGDFTNWAGVGTMDYIGKYNATTSGWEDITAAGACDGNVNALAVAPNGTVYAGGNFANIGGVACAYIAMWDGTIWSAMGAGMDRAVDAIAIAPDGTVYAGGSFTEAGGVSALGVAKWDGAAWTALGDGLSGDANWVRSLKVADNGDLLACGSFDRSGDTALYNIARWNGHTWSTVGGNLSLARVDGIGLGFYDPVIPSDYDIYFGMIQSGTLEHAGLTTVTNNGTATAFPRFTFERNGGTAATLLTIRNETTGLEMLFNLSLLDGEKITVDLTPGNKTIQSNWRGNVIGSLLPNSDFANFALMPGENRITCYCALTGDYDETVVTSHIIWREQYWSVSGAE